MSSTGITSSAMQFTFKNKRSSVSFCWHDISLKIKILNDFNEMFYKNDEFV
ncbi:hypothetical protein [Wolbachia endosymbiont of Nilaparvata lugens]|uniref:hypothetical protein n=1 Tax=Wolbachia endosymbiont of Nilaparvata lugens TaxID=357143 RepID=UPI0019D6493C|nr:hypothetical protein [Wolbachia endosymbiont of Nilaparvata lugens]